MTLHVVVEREDQQWQMLCLHYDKCRYFICHQWPSVRSKYCCGANVRTILSRIKKRGMTKNNAV